MRDYIKKLAEGNMEYEQPKIRLSDSVIEFVVSEGGGYSGCFIMETFSEELIKGKVYTTDARMKIEKPFFSGYEITINYHFNGIGLMEGENVTGSIFVVYNGGELSIPFTARLENCFSDTSLGKIKNLYHFANLASSHWQEAFRLFRQPDFRKILKNGDKQYIPVYEGLTKETIREQDLEEFLISAKKKNPVNYTIDRASNLIEKFSSSIRSSIIITKSTWGYVDLSVSSDTPFIRLEKERINLEDFVGSKFELGYIVDKKFIHGGKNFGRIYIKSSYQTLTFEIVVQDERNEILSTSSEEKVLKYKLLGSYINFRLARITTSAWIKDSSMYLEKLEIIDPNSILYRAQILIGAGDLEGAWQILIKYKKDNDIKMMKPEIQGYFYYLCVFINQGEIELTKAAKEVRELYKKHKDNWKLLWLLLYLDKDIDGNNKKKLDLIEASFYKKGYSPIMYLEAYRLIKEDPSLLTKLGQFEMQVCWWVCRNEMLTSTLSYQIVSLANNRKTFHPLTYRILVSCYEKYKEADTVKVICSYLIKGNQVKKEYFKWFQLGISLDLNVTKLYEYYMESLNIKNEGTLPHRLLMYFAYNNQLDYTKKAFLYRSIIKNKEVEPIIYRNYLKQIDKFVYDQIRLERINEDLAFLYDEMILPEQITRELGNFLAPILFTYRFSCSDKNIKSVTVIHRQFHREEKVPCIDGKALIHIYTRDNVIVLKDHEDNSYISSIPYTITPLLNHSNFEKRCIEAQADYVPLLVHHYEDQVQLLEDEELYYGFLNKIIESPMIRERYRQKLLWKKIRSHFQKNKIEEIGNYWEALNFNYLQPLDAGLAIEIMIFMKKNLEAYQLLQKYGPERTSLKRLIKLCSNMIWSTDSQKEDALVYLCYYVFLRGKYNDVILEYLVEYFEGNYDSLVSLWHAVNDFEVEHHALTERIITQGLYCMIIHRKKDEVFAEYFQAGMRNQLVTAYLTTYAYEYFLKEEKIPDAIFNCFYELMASEECLGDLCKLAFLKYHSDQAQIDEKLYSCIKKAIEEFCLKDMRFEFFQKLNKYCIPDFYIPISTVVEYRADSKSRVFIHYLLECENKESDEYQTEEMKNLCCGIFVKEFILFYGEHLQYYITEETVDGEQITESSLISFKDVNMGKNQGRFELINDILFSKHTNDDKTLFELVSQFVEKNYITDKGLKIR